MKYEIKDNPELGKKETVLLMTHIRADESAK